MVNIGQKYPKIWKLACYPPTPANSKGERVRAEKLCAQQQRSTTKYIVSATYSMYLKRVECVYLPGYRNAHGYTQYLFMIYCIICPTCEGDLAKGIELQKKKTVREAQLGCKQTYLWQFCVHVQPQIFNMHFRCPIHARWGLPVITWFISSIHIQEVSMTCILYISVKINHAYPNHKPTQLSGGSTFL